MAVTDIAAKYSPLVSWLYDRVAAPAVLDAVTPLIGRLATATPTGSSVLEVGCGGGQFAHRLITTHSGISVTGIDRSAEQIDRATGRSTHLSPADAARVHFQVGSALELPFADNSFDVVVSIASIKHWPDRQQGVAEMVRVVKGGGLLLVAEADRGCHLADARQFARTTRLPAALRIPYLWMFRTYVAGQGLDLDDAHELLAGQALVDTAVQRVAATPFLVFTARKHMGGLIADGDSMPTGVSSLDP